MLGFYGFRLEFIHIQGSAFWMPDCSLNWDKTIKAGAKLDIFVEY